MRNDGSFVIDKLIILIMACKSLLILYVTRFAHKIKNKHDLKKVLILYISLYVNNDIFSNFEKLVKSEIFSSGSKWEEMQVVKLSRLLLCSQIQPKVEKPFPRLALLLMLVYAFSWNSIYICNTSFPFFTL